MQSNKIGGHFAHLHLGHPSYIQKHVKGTHCNDNSRIQLTHYKEKW